MGQDNNTITPKETEFGKAYFSDKDAAYLNKVSKQVVEDHNNVSILYFAIDWVHSHRNFYGELLHKKFSNPFGTQIKGILKLEQGGEQLLQSLPYKLMKMTVSIYTDQLKQLNVEPQLGEYFSVGNRFYRIYNKTIDDVGPGNLMINRGRMRCDYNCIEEDNEVISQNPWTDGDLGTEADLRP